MVYTYALLHSGEPSEAFSDLSVVVVKVVFFPFPSEFLTSPFFAPLFFIGTFSFVKDSG